MEGIELAEDSTRDEGTGAEDAVLLYVGGPLEVVMLDYGPPDNVIEIGAGERAYQWRRVNTEAVTGTTSGEVRQTRHGERYEVSESPGYVKETECFYTFYARAAGTRWIVTNFRKPKLECERTIVANARLSKGETLAESVVQIAGRIPSDAP